MSVMEQRMPVPRVPAVTIDVHRSDSTWDSKARKLVERPSLHVYYIGSPEELVRLGLVTAETLEKRPRRGKRRPRLDTLGNHFTVERWYRCRGGGPAPTLKVTYSYLDPERALELPGVREAIAARDAAERPRQAANADRSAEPADEALDRLLRPQSVAEWKSSARSSCEAALGSIAVILERRIDAARRFRLNGESLARIQARAAQCLAELFGEIDRARVVDSQQPRPGALLRLAVDNTREGRS